MFGANEPLLRAFRYHRGKEEAGLVYQSQLEVCRSKSLTAEIGKDSQRPLRNAQIRSITIAIPCPTPIHIVQRA